MHGKGHGSRDSLGSRPHPDSAQRHFRRRNTAADEEEEAVAAAIADRARYSASSVRARRFSLLLSWLVGSRRYKLSRRMPRGKLKRKRGDLIKKQQQKQHLCTPALSARHRCQILKLSNNILRVNTRNLLCLLN
ncbi:hypothetical protein chiPu_0005270 [Chiloscyllium punctatum]|uniref:Uncharacterized protein n=1 Tax=Chiloscyllium punctatum TaxID=137246 RepID=A0A401S941_CHIPU|nr:hypothetical protein [Chiloscyllium punctatum]